MQKDIRSGLKRLSQNKELADIIKKEKYCQEGETFKELVDRVAGVTAEDNNHFRVLQDILYNERFLPGGRIQSSVGSLRDTTPLNCYVSRTIPDSLKGINETIGEAMETLRLGGGIGYDFSTLRPSGDRITSLDSTSSGPVGNSQGNSRGFMDWFDAGCAVIRSAGHRRGAQMGVLRVDHPDIYHFIRAKREQGRLVNFNVSVGVTDEFMEAVKNNTPFSLRFEGREYEKINARNLWEEIMRNTWDYAEPGVLFIDKINRKNNLYYCEAIAATNPCGEQPLPPYGACLLGSFNLTKYLNFSQDHQYGKEVIKGFNWELFKQDITHVVPMMDNVLDVATYPLEQQKQEALNKRRMGLGVTGLAHTAEVLGFPYGSEAMKSFTEEVLTQLRNTAYLTSIELAAKKEPFPLFDKEKYCNSEFIKTLSEEIQESVAKHGIRNSHLLSIAPTGTISLSAGNISSSIEPPYTKGNYERNVYRPDGSVSTFNLSDWATDAFGVEPVTSDECSVSDHVDILNICSNLVDSSVSKTCNVGDNVSFQEFKDVYMKAYEGGASGCTTFRAAGFREGIMSKTASEKNIEEGSACYIDPDTGQRSCE